MAFQACEIGGTLPAVLNAANETAVHGFLNQGIAFIDIVPVIRQTMEKHPVVSNPGLSDILAADLWARKCAQDIISGLK